MGIGKFFKKIGGGIKDAGKQIGKSVVNNLDSDKIANAFGKVPIIGGGLKEAALAGGKVGEALANKDYGGAAKGLAGVGKAGFDSLKQAATGGFMK